MKLQGTVTGINRFYKSDATDYLLAHTTKGIYNYNTTHKWFENIVDTELTAADTNFTSATTITDLYISTNWTDYIKKWNGTDVNTSNLANATSYKAKWLLYFGERLCMYYVEESSTPYHQRVRYSVAGDPEDFTGSGSGATDLRAVLNGDGIMRAEMLGSYAIIYGEWTIAMQEYKGDYTAPFGYYTRVPSVGLPAPLALANMGDRHIFLGSDNVYSYAGGRTVERLGDKIRDELFDTADPTYLNKSFMYYVEEEDLVYLHFAAAGSTVPNKYYVYNVHEKTWSIGSRRATCAGMYETKSDITWDEDVGTWDEDTGRWDTRSALALAPITLLGDDHGVIYKRDTSTYNVGVDVIDGYMDTKDFVRGTRYIREITNWMELNFEARGQSVAVYYSTDLGVSYILLSNVTLTDVWTNYTLDFGVNSETIRFRFRNINSDEWFEGRDLEIGFLPASNRGL